MTVRAILSRGTVEEQAWELTSAKAAAQWAAFDAKALYRSVEEVMAKAASAQVEVVRRVVEVEREPLGVDRSSEPEEEPTVAADQRQGQLTELDLFLALF